MRQLVFLQCVIVPWLMLATSAGGQLSIRTTIPEGQLDIRVNDSINATFEITSRTDNQTDTPLHLVFLTKPKGSKVIAKIDDFEIKKGANLPFKFNVEVRAANKGNAKVLPEIANSTENVTTSKAILTIKVHEYDELEVVSDLVGWVYFVAWTLSFYPQIYENWRRKSVVGLNFDFLALNLVGFSIYSIYNVGLYWVKVIRDEYLEYNQTLVLPVKANDVAFGLHAVAACLITIVQCFVYDRGGQVVSKTCRFILAVMGLYFVAVLTCTAARPAFTWCDFLTWASYIKLAVTAIKYVPQAYMNFLRKSTEGWSIGNVLLDFTGGSFSILQMSFDVFNFADWSVITGDPVKFGLGLLSVAFDILFVIQHYVCFRSNRPSLSENAGLESDENRLIVEDDDDEEEELARAMRDHSPSLRSDFETRVSPVNLNFKPENAALVEEAPSSVEKTTNPS